MNRIETLHSIAGKWECGSNNQLDSQHFFTRFEEADRQFQLQTGLSDAIVGPRKVRHVRFHTPVPSGSLLTVKSFVAFDGPHMLTVVHEMVASPANQLVATAIDGYDPNPSSAKSLRNRFKAVQGDMPDHASPNAIPASPATARGSLDSVLKSGSEICFRGSVQPRHLSADGKVDDGFALQTFSEGTPHFWQRTPLSLDYLNEIGAAMQMLETKLSWISPLKNGDMFVVTSGITGVGGNNISLRQYLFESRTSRLVAICDLTCQLTDASSGTALNAADEIRKELTSAIIN